MSGISSSDPPAPEALELEAVIISREREEEPEETQTGRVIDHQARDKSQNDNSKKDVKPISNQTEFNLMTIQIVLDLSLYISRQLDEKTFSDGFSFILGKWTSKPHVKVTSIGGCLFKLFLWCLRYCNVRMLMIHK